MWQYIAYNKAMHFQQPEVANFTLQTTDPIGAMKIMRPHYNRAVVSAKGAPNRSKAINIGLNISKDDDDAWKRDHASAAALRAARAKFSVLNGRATLLRTRPYNLQFCDQSDTWGVDNHTNKDGRNVIGEALMRHRAELERLAN